MKEHTISPVLNEHHNTRSPSRGLNELNGRWNGHGHQLFFHSSTRLLIQSVMSWHGDKDMVGNGVENPREVQRNEIHCSCLINKCSLFTLESSEDGQSWTTLSSSINFSFRHTEMEPLRDVLWHTPHQSEA